MDLLEHAPELVEGDEVPFLPWSLVARARRLRGRLAQRPTYRRWVLFVVLGSFFSVGFTVTILSVAIPRISHEFHSSEATVAWAVTGPLLAYAVLQPTIGKLGDQFGHKRLWMIGLAAEGVAAILIALSWNAGSLIVFRILGGGVGAAASPTSMALLMELFEPRERVRALGWWSFVGAGAPVLGVVAGGPLIEHLSWRAIFLIQSPLCLAALGLGIVLLPSRRPETESRFDLAGSILITASISAGLLALNRASLWGWSSPFVVACAVVFPVAAVAFVAVERRAASPLLPLEFLARRNFSAPLIVQFFGNFVYMGSFLITPIFLQDVMGYTATRAGLAVVARPLTFSITAPLFGYVAMKLGERFNAVTGMVAIVASMGVFSLVKPGVSPALIYLALCLAGFGLGMASPSLNATVANSVPEENLGVASAALGMMMSIGGVVGMEVMRAFQSFRVAAGVTPATAYDQAYLFGGVLALAAVAAALFVRRAEVEEGEPLLARREAA